jgi:hypothetical protein
VEGRLAIGLINIFSQSKFADREDGGNCGIPMELFKIPVFGSQLYPTHVRLQVGRRGNEDDGALHNATSMLIGGLGMKRTGCMQHGAEVARVAGNWHGVPLFLANVSIHGRRGHV